MLLLDVGARCNGLDKRFMMLFFPPFGLKMLPVSLETRLCSPHVVAGCCCLCVRACVFLCVRLDMVLEQS